MKAEVKEVLEDGSQALELTYTDGGGKFRVLAKSEGLYWDSGTFRGCEVKGSECCAVLYRALYEDQLGSRPKAALKAHSWIVTRGRLQGRLDYIVDELKRRQDFILQRLGEENLTGPMDEKVVAWDDAAGKEVEPG